MIRVPELIGTSIEDAKSAIGSVSGTVGHVTEDHSDTVASGLIGAAMAVGLLWVSAWALFDKYLLDQQSSGTAFISSADVWVIAPFLLVGVVLLAVGTSTVTLWRYLRV